jgi:uncharacterized SAM-binding protein YcdF (DUF218 family)
MMYLVRQAIGALATPLMLAVLIGAIAAAVQVLGRRRPARWLLFTAVAVAYLGATSAVGDALIAPLERQYPPLRDNQLPAAVDYIVVLGASYAPHDDVPITAALDEEGLARGVEGIRLFLRSGARHLVLSGGAPPGLARPAVGYSVLARSLGVHTDSLILLGNSLNTTDEAHAVAASIGSAPFILVTSAYHMPRAVRLMERAGTHPIPAPTGQRMVHPRGPSVRDWLPSSFGLRKSESALHEYVGLFALRLDAI